ncbi:MAG: ATP-binding protein [Acidobacteria bacterium]|nr:ATP-binding protein [Acidobacteriota bacterium]
MSSETKSLWTERNQVYLAAALREIRDLLRTRCEQLGLELPAKIEPGVSASAEIGKDDRPPALVTLSRLFHLSSFERRILVLCAGVELDSSIAALCARLQADARHRFPSFSLALSLLPDAHWSALSPAAPLRYWRLIEADKNPSLTACSLRIDECILHYLTGVGHLDERLWRILKPCKPEGSLPASHEAIVDAIVKASSLPKPPHAAVIQLSGKEKSSKRNIAAAVCGRLSLGLYAVSMQSIPSNPAELDTLIRLCAREAALTGAALLLEFDEFESPDLTRTALAGGLAEQAGIIIISTPAHGDYGIATMLSLEVKRPTQPEQHAVWEEAADTGRIGPAGLDNLTGQFNLDSSSIRAAAAEASMSTNRSGKDSQEEIYQKALWAACRSRARGRLDELAMRIEPAGTWDDLVLPPAQIGVLKNIAIHLRQRVRVYQEWGFAAKSNRGLGISALFSGESGTGKTMAAEVLAIDLQLDLFRIDLSQVVSKYIGETEKNLRRVFDAAEDGGAILLFDEADALFGKRSEVKDSHDRYANIEVSYLLQRMEAYRGLAILTTNMKNALDSAFLRRIRFVVQFPFPDAASRAEIWRCVFPEKTPVGNLDFEKLARLNIAGGGIHNIAMNAAFFAAQNQTAVQMSHLLEATRIEYAKLEKPLIDSEPRGWV